MVLVHLSLICTPGDLKIRSCLNICLCESKFANECGAILDMRRNPKNAVRKAALNNTGSLVCSHALEMSANCLVEKTPLLGGGICELSLRLLRSRKTA